MKINTILYRAHASVSGGRDGRGRSADGALEVTLSLPKELGGNGGPGTNPEQLFAVGYAACFIGALKYVAQQRQLKLPTDPHIESQVGIGQIPGGFGIEVALEIHLPGLAREVAEDLVHAAHQVCPYSNATRNNIEVRLSVIV